MENLFSSEDRPENYLDLYPPGMWQVARGQCRGKASDVHVRPLAQLATYLPRPRRRANRDKSVKIADNTKPAYKPMSDHCRYITLKIG